ncbi:LOW QUALITY PROTEIN: sodium channel subunit beta-3 [Egretta garzetta]|nr:LOW QUALITY PROTEIN: sodium channel subunit beta-3 [Egretta garzetta]
MCRTIGMETMMPLLSGSHKQPLTSFLPGICDRVDGLQHNRFYIEGCEAVLTMPSGSIVPTFCISACVRVTGERTSTACPCSQVGQPPLQRWKESVSVSKRSVALPAATQRGQRYLPDLRNGAVAFQDCTAPASSVVLVVWAGFCSAVCVEVPSETEAVQGTHMKLLCISCMKREEVTASTVVEWFYRPEGGKDEPIYEYRKTNHEFPSRFSGRLQWNGSKDMQDVSITVLNVTLNDSGIYTCNITREFEFEIHRPLFTSSRLIHLTVVEEAGEDFTSVISEIMMYILLVFLTLWLLIEMVYCYRKVSKAEEAAQENATDYLAIPSENKENCAVPVEE